MKKKIVALALGSICCNMAIGQKSSYKNADLPVESRVKDLVSRMTLQEKILQLTQYTFGENNNPNNIGSEVKKLPPETGSLIYFSADPVLRNQIQLKVIKESRLGIPILFGFDVIHGFRTIYPIPLAQASSWNPELVSQACRMAAKETKLSGIDWTFSPMIDIGRDPRWGRVSESYGEDPFTNSVFGSATVKGYQGQKLSDPFSIAACLKHYVGYGVSEGGRDYRYSDISRQSLWDTYLPPYQACIKAGAGSVMSAFNDISGVPATSNHYTLTELLKVRWGFDGFVVSDWNAIEQLVNQGVAKDKEEACLKAFTAGVDVDMRDGIFPQYLTKLVLSKKVPMSRVNDAVSRVLRVKFRIGLFEHPFTPVTAESDRYLQPESKNTATKLAEQSMVLLKNDHHILPLSEHIKKIALIGPMATDQTNLIGSWSFNGQVEDVENIAQGLNEEFKDKAIFKYVKGCDFDGADESGFDEAVAAAEASDIVIICIGEKKGWTGENASRSTIALPTIQEKLVSALKRTGKQIILVLSNGRPIELARLAPMADALLEIWQPGITGGKAVAGILSGRVNPSGKLPITFPLTTGQIPMYYNMRPSARPFEAMGDYQDISAAPMYDFGFGLSYSNFEYSLLKASALKIKKNQRTVLGVNITNTSAVPGQETIFWYISHPSATISRPIKELRYFEKKSFSAGQTLLFKFEIDPLKDLSYSDQNGKIVCEPGDYYVMVGGQKIKIQLTQ